MKARSCFPHIPSLSLIFIMIFLFSQGNSDNFLGYHTRAYGYLGATVELDQKAYTWTDVVWITIIAPDQNFDPNLIDVIGNNNLNRVTISTKNHIINQYELVETGVDTGIFTGYVRLTGDKNILPDGIDGMGLNPTGSGPSGTGPSDGTIPSEDDDTIIITFTDSHGTINSTALVKWNIGDIKWMNTKYPSNGQGVLQIIDPDMNLNPKAVDKFDTDIWSDSDSVGIKLTMTETGEATGIFQGTVKFDSKSSSSSEAKLKAFLGDTVTAKYLDRTLPAPYSHADVLPIISKTFIGNTPNGEDSYYGLAKVIILKDSGVDSSCANEFGCFSPIVTKVVTNTTVTWFNDDTSAHIITSGMPDDNNAGSIFNSSIIQSGHSYSHIFMSPGTYDYFDSLHPWMSGKIAVNSGVPAPSIWYDDKTYRNVLPEYNQSTYYIDESQIYSFPKVRHQFSDGSYLSLLRLLDEKGNHLKYDFQTGNYSEPTKYVPEISHCSGPTTNKLYQEGTTWSKPNPPNPKIIGFSTIWTMPVGNINSGGGIYFNPVNFHYPHPTSQNLNIYFFQVDFAKGTIPDIPEGWYVTVAQTNHDHITPDDYHMLHLNTIGFGNLVPGQQFRIDAALESAPTAIPPKFVVTIKRLNDNISIYRNVTLGEYGDGYNPIPGDIEKIQSFNDEYLTTNNIDMSLTSDAYTGLEWILDDGNNITHVPISSPVSSKFIDTVNSTFTTSNVLNPVLKNTDPVLANLVECSQYIPEFGPSTAIFTISIFTIILISSIKIKKNSRIKY